MSILNLIRKALAHTNVRPLSKKDVDALRAELMQLRPTKEQNLRGVRERGESIDAFVFRDATEADIPTLAQVHVTAWNATYPGTNNPPTVALRERQWRKAFTKENDGSWFCVLIERPDKGLVGFARGRRSDHPDYQGELNKIYLLPEYYRLGLGRRLMAHVARRFLARGITSMWLCGEADNPTAAFHEALGGRNMTNDDGTTNYGNFAWDDLQRLAEICPIEAPTDSSLRSERHAGGSG
jgi:ribosomal protein S18 acetylase RimI-like enzyme